MNECFREYDEFDCIVLYVPYLDMDSQPKLISVVAGNIYIISKTLMTPGCQKNKKKKCYNRSSIALLSYISVIFLDHHILYLN